MKKRRVSKEKTMRPTFFVFCEGKSEEAYVKYLRSKYKLPIDIDPSVAGLSISEKHISNYKRGKDIDPRKDKDFLMYDLDRADVLPRLQAIRGAVIIASNPCFELWYLLHYKNQTSALTSEKCNELLLSYVKSYCKGSMCRELIKVLTDNNIVASERAASLVPLENPYTDMHKFISELEAIKSCK